MQVDNENLGFLSQHMETDKNNCNIFFILGVSPWRKRKETMGHIGNKGPV